MVRLWSSYYVKLEWTVCTRASTHALIKSPGSDSMYWQVSLPLWAQFETLASDQTHKSKSLVAAASWHLQLLTSSHRSLQRQVPVSVNVSKWARARVLTLCFYFLPVINFGILLIISMSSFSYMHRDNLFFSFPFSPPTTLVISFAPFWHHCYCWNSPLVTVHREAAERLHSVTSWLQSYFIFYTGASVYRGFI